MKKKLALGIFSFLASLIVLDSLLYKLVPKPCLTVESDQLVHHRLIPNKKCQVKNDEFDVEYRNNSLGLRDVEFPEKRPVGEKRVLFLGDSFTEGSGVRLEDTMVKQAEELLQKKFNEQGTRTINAGVSAYSPLLESLYLQNRGIALAPNIVVVNLFMNDFNDDRSYLQKAHYTSDGQVSGVYVELKQHLPTWLIHYLDGRSFLYYVFKQQERALWKLKGKVVAWLRHEAPPDYTKSGVEFVPGDPDGDPFAITRDISPESFQELFEPTSMILLQMKKFLDEQRIPMVVIVIPAGHQVGQSQWTSGRLTMHLSEDSFPSKIFEELSRFSKESSVFLLDLTPGLREFLKNQPNAKLYYDSDGHFSPLGQRIAAELFVEFISQRPELANRLKPN